MDFSLAALKLLCAQLKSARQTPSQNAFSLAGILFQRAWIQGILVFKPSSSSEGVGGQYLLDDGTGVIELYLSSEFIGRPWETGMYVMVVGAYVVRGDLPMLKVHKLVDLSPFPDREPMWYLEVMEAFMLFYQPLLEEWEGESDWRWSALRSNYLIEIPNLMLVSSWLAFSESRSRSWPQNHQHLK